MMTQGDIEKLTITMEKAAAKLEQDIMLDIVRRIKANEGMTSTAEYQIQRLRQLGLADQYIREEIQTYLKASAEEVDRIFRDVPESEYNKFGSLYQQMGMEQTPFGNHTAIQAVIAATMTQTDSTFKNISQSLGFTVQKGGKTEFLPIAEYYQQTLDNAILGIATGAFDYTSALNRAVKEMTRSGLRTVDYASGRSYRIESATRTALMTGFSQITRYMNEQTAAELGTDDYEVSYHMGARPTHQWWQGRVYSYQELLFICGLGTVTGLCGINCYHWYEPFIRGISVRNYTDEQLDAMIQEENMPRSYRGKEYTAYTALQKQRKMELTMRKQRQDIVLLKEGGGNSLDILAAQTRYRTTMNEYVSFSKAMNMPQQIDRVYMDGLGKVTGKSIEKRARSGIMNLSGTKENIEVHSVGKINRDIYKCITEDIVTDEVIITDERIEHIKERHPNDYERFYSYIPEIINDPDFIIEANKPNTAVVLKEIEERGEKFKLVLRIKVQGDPEEYKNSIMTFWRIGETTWRKTLKNKTVLYKKE